MCGISGYVGLHSPKLLEAMCDTMAHRGPDDSGAWVDREAGVGLGHRRLSIIDLSKAGHQPMSIGSSPLRIAYNGEIYNFQQHRDRYLSEGVQLQSRTDTEIILRLWQERGVDALHHLNGMFAFAMWDGSSKQLTLARDHAGIKPLYYWQNHNSLYFASEIKSLVQIPELRRSVDTTALEDYLTFLWVPGNKTMLEGVKKLEPGHYLTWQDGQVKIKRWFSLSYDPDYSKSIKEWAEETRETLEKTVRRQMVSDAPLGAFLSGGLDSSAIAAFMRSAHPQRVLNTYTVRFPKGDIANEQGADDYPYAVRVAKHLNVNLKTINMQPDVIKLLPKMVYHLDEPDADPAVFPSYLISRLARDDGTTVLLSGTGGDEVFFGYRSHLAYQSYARLANPLCRALLIPISGATKLVGTIFNQQHTGIRRAKKFLRGYFSETGLERHLNLVDWSNPELRQKILHQKHLRPRGRKPGSLEKYYSEFLGSGEINRHSHLLNQTFLAAHNFLYTDKTSMAASLEVRVPFTDLDVLRLGSRIPEEIKLGQGQTKHVLKRSMEGILPHDVIYRPKTGFGAPLRKWIRGDLAEVIKNSLDDHTIRKRGLFSPRAIGEAMAANHSGQEDNAYLIYALFSLEIWMQTFIDQPGTEISF